MIRDGNTSIYINMLSSMCNIILIVIKISLNSNKSHYV